MRLELWDGDRAEHQPYGSCSPFEGIWIGVGLAAPDARLGFAVAGTPCRELVTTPLQRRNLSQPQEDSSTSPPDEDQKKRSCREVRRQGLESTCLCMSWYQTPASLVELTAPFEVSLYPLPFPSRSPFHEDLAGLALMTDRQTASLASGGRLQYIAAN
jgi:hypothetical protein